MVCLGLNVFPLYLSEDISLGLAVFYIVINSFFEPKELRVSGGPHATLNVR